MAIVDIILKTDKEEIPEMEVGSIVIPVSGMKLESPATTNVETLEYGFAIVISMSPFVLVSERADMRWQYTVSRENFVPIGKVIPEVFEKCKTRLNG